MPALAAAIPPYIDFVTVVADPDADGPRFAGELKAALTDRCISHRMLVWGNAERIAA
jgi:hypothetical protein